MSHFLSTFPFLYLSLAGSTRTLPSEYMGYSPFLLRSDPVHSRSPNPFYSPKQDDYN